MKKALFILFFLLMGETVLAQVINNREYKVYKEVMDSLFDSMEYQIKVDLGLNGYKILKQTPDDVEFDGYIMIVRAYFTPRLDYILALVTGEESSMHRKFRRQTSGLRFRRQLYLQGFSDYIEENRKIPELYKITYKFIAMYLDSPPDHSIFGEYVFKMNEDEKFEISERAIEVLRSKEEFQLKYNANF